MNTETELETPLRLVYLDDDPNDRSRLRMKLEPGPFHIDELSSYRENVRTTAKDADVVLLDILVDGTIHNAEPVATNLRRERPSRAVAYLTNFPPPDSGHGAVNFAFRKSEYVWSKIRWFTLAVVLHDKAVSILNSISILAGPVEGVDKAEIERSMPDELNRYYELLQIVHEEATTDEQVLSDWADEASEILKGICEQEHVSNDDLQQLGSPLLLCAERIQQSLSDVPQVTISPGVKIRLEVLRSQLPNQHLKEVSTVVNRLTEGGIENVETGDLGRACKQLDDRVDWRTIEPANITDLLTVLRPLEKAVQPQADQPDLPRESPAARIAMALWAKQNPQRASLEPLLDSLRDELPVVRIAAVEALQAIVHEGAREPYVATQLRRAVEEQRLVEPSTVLRYRQGELLSALVSQRQLRRRREAAPIRLNPYVAGLPIRDATRFFGRNGVVDQIRRLLLTPGVTGVVIHGARRTGKTSLLYRLREGVLGEEYLPIYVDLQSIAGESVETLLHTVAEAVVDAAAGNAAWSSIDLYPAAHPRTLTEFLSWMREVLSLAGANAPAPVFLLDEYEVLTQFLHDPSFARQFQSMYENLDGAFWVFAGAEKVEELTEKAFLSLIDTTKYIRLGVLSPETTENLIREPARGVLTFSDEAVRLIQNFSGGHPFYTQFLCQLIFELVGSGESVEAEHVQQAVTQFVRDPSPHLILTWNTLHLHQKVVGAAMAQLMKRSDWVTVPALQRYLRHEDFPLRLSAGQIQEALIGLAELDLASKRTGEDEYRLTSGLAALWIREARSLWSVASEYRASLVAKPAGYPTRVVTLAMDAALFVLVAGLAAAAFALTSMLISISVTTMWVLGALVALLLYALSIIYRGGTPAMRIMDLRIRPVAGSQISIGRALGLAAVLVVRVCSWIAAVAMVASWTAAPGWDPFYTIGIVGLVLEASQFVSLRFSKDHRGLYDRMMGIVIVKDSPR